jgi:tight adherence protein C
LTAIPASVVVGICLLAATLPLLAWAFSPQDARLQRQVRQNLTLGLGGDEKAKVTRTHALSYLAGQLTPPSSKIKLDRLHALAGRPVAWPLSRLYLVKPALALAALVLGLLLLSSTSSGLLVVIVLVITVVAYFIPDLLLYSRGVDRQESIALELADTLDQMLIAVEAGLGFEASMARAGENGKGPLANELMRTLQDMRVGMSRRDAYQALADRTNVPDLRAFIRAVVQADAYGISIATVLRTQAKEMRLKRRQRAEEKAMKIPVKVLFPLMLFILPVLFIAVLGPTVLTIISSFG